MEGFLVVLLLLCSVSLVTSQDVYLAQIRTFAFDFQIRDHAPCSGQILAINQNQAMFSLLGTYYGGNGYTTFALPNLNGRVPLSSTSSTEYGLGQVGGSASVTLTTDNIPPINVSFSSIDVAQTTCTSGSSNGQAFVTSSNLCDNEVISSSFGMTIDNTVGSTQPISNLMPYMGLSMQIVLTGSVFPSREKRSTSKRSAFANSVTMYATDFVPRYHLAADGRNGSSTYQTPNFAGRIARGVGQGAGLTEVTLLEYGGAKSVKLEANQIPTPGSGTATLNNAVSSPGPYFCDSNIPAILSKTTCSGDTTTSVSVPMNGAGTPQARDNIQPYLGLTFGVTPPDTPLQPGDSEAFIGEMRMFTQSTVPNNWFVCDGTILPISQFTALFALIGTTYGGNGQQTFALPDMRGRVAVGTGYSNSPIGSVTIGQTGGFESISITKQQVPTLTSKTLSIFGRNQKTTSCTTKEGGIVQGKSICQNTETNSASMNYNSNSAAPHSNLQPYVGVVWGICHYGVFPNRA